MRVVRPIRVQALASSYVDALHGGVHSCMVTWEHSMRLRIMCYQ